VRAGRVLPVLLVFLLVLGVLRVGGEPQRLRVYYGYVPPSTNLPALDEMVQGRVVSFTPPPGTALLDVIGFEDGTRVEIRDLLTGLLINATTLNAREKKHFYIPYGTYFKVVATKRVGVLLTGGWGSYDSGWWGGGVGTFYPTVEGGFRGRRFIFMPAPATHQYYYTREAVHYNFFIFAVEDADWYLRDRIGRFETRQSLKRANFDYTTLQSRVNHMGVTSAVGYDSVFELTTTGDVMVCSAALGALIQVPALTGGYVGRQFWVPLHMNWREEGRSAVLIIIPLEPCEVVVLRTTGEEVARRSFTSDDVARRSFWFLSLGVGRFNLLVKSTGDITVLAAATRQQVSPDFLVDGIAFLGSRPGQEVRFYTPSSAVIFSMEDQDVVIDGVSRRMKQDEFVTVGSGVHSVKGSGHLVVQILSPGAGFNKWGHYLIEAADIDASYPEAPELFERGTPITTYAGAGAAVAAAAALVAIRRRRKK
jgi:hypothetical protein